MSGRHPLERITGKDTVSRSIIQGGLIDWSRAYPACSSSKSLFLSFLNVYIFVKEAVENRARSGDACCTACLNERVIPAMTIQQHAFPIARLSGILSVHCHHNGGERRFLAGHLQRPRPLLRRCRPCRCRIYMFWILYSLHDFTLFDCILLARKN